MELIKPSPGSPVNVDTMGYSYDNLQRLLRYNSDTRQYAATAGIANQETASVHISLSVNVSLPAGLSTIEVEWIDTPGEVWSRNWGEENPEQWNNIVTQVQGSEGIMLILPPYREMPGLKAEDANIFPTQYQWSQRFERWLNFFSTDCSQARYIIICLNFADLFCDTTAAAYMLSQKNWYQRHDYISHKYFSPIKSKINNVSYNHSGFIRCFITSIFNRTLLELPWLYLASHLA